MNDEMIDILAQGGTPVVARIYTKTGSIENRVEIGDILEEIQKLEKETLFLKEYKSHRVSSIDEKMTKISENVEILRNAILEYMQTNKETKIDCPDVGAVTSRKTKGSYIIDDEESLTKFLEKTGVLTDVASQQWKFDKKKLNKLLEEMKSNSNLPTGVHQEKDEPSLAISFVNKIEKAPKKIDKNENVSSSEMNYDKLTI